MTPPNHVCSPVPTARPPPAPGSGAFAGWSPCRALPLGQRAAGRRERRGWPQPAARATRTRGRAGAWTGGPWGQRLLVGSGPSAGAPSLTSRSEESRFPPHTCVHVHTHTHGANVHTSHTNSLFVGRCLSRSERSVRHPEHPPQVRFTVTTAGSQRPGERGDRARKVRWSDGDNAAWPQGHRRPV